MFILSSLKFWMDDIFYDQKSVLIFGSGDRPGYLKPQLSTGIALTGICK